MEDGEKQIGQMVSFILHEAKQKAAELESKAREEFNITKMQIVKDQREKIRKEFAAKQKRLETQQAIQETAAKLTNDCFGGFHVQARRGHDGRRNRRHGGGRRNC